MLNGPGKAVLAAYGIPVVATRVVPAEAAAAANWQARSAIRYWP